MTAARHNAILVQIRNSYIDARKLFLNLLTQELQNIAVLGQAAVSYLQRYSSRYTHYSI